MKLKFAAKAIAQLIKAGDLGKEHGNHVLLHNPQGINPSGYGDKTCPQ